MGLTIHYGIGIKEENPSITTVKAMVNQLRERCMDLPFYTVTEVTDIKGDECDFEKRRQVEGYNQEEDEWSWLLIQACQYVQYDDGWYGITASEDGRYHSGVSPQRVIAFCAWPGEGCEAANIGLCKFPKTVLRKSRYTNRNARLWLDNPGWSWGSFCKTEYARNVSLEHFLRCHLLVIQMLDIAKEIGFDVNVSDEGDYWQERDIELLVRNIGESSQHLALLVGALKDTVGGKMEAPITARPDFEHIEAQGHNELSEEQKANFEKTLLTIKGVSDTVQETMEIDNESCMSE